jgi:hypothetical protein
MCLKREVLSDILESINQFNLILDSFNIKALCMNAQQIDNYVYYDLRLSPHTKVKDIARYSDEISLALKKPCKPSIKVLHELGVVRLEFATPHDKTLNLPMMTYLKVIF